MAIQSPLLETSINGARGVIINVTGSMDLKLEDVDVAANMVQQAAHEDANIIFGAAFDETLEDELSITVIATNFDENSGSASLFTDVRAEAPSQAADGQDGKTPAPVPLDTEADDDIDEIIELFKRRDGR